MRENRNPERKQKENKKINDFVFSLHFLFLKHIILRFFALQIISSAHTKYCTKCLDTLMLYNVQWNVHTCALFLPFIIVSVFRMMEAFPVAIDIQCGFQIIANETSL